MTKQKVTKQNPIYVTKVDEPQGIVGAVVNVYGITDLGNDRLHPGVFKKSIQEAFPKGKIKVLDNHNTRSATDIVGRPIALRELSRNELPDTVTKAYPDATGGLYAETKFNLKTEKGRDIFNLINDGDLTEYSIGFYLQDFDNEQSDNGTIRNIRTGHLLEYSPVIWGMNQATATVSAKHDTDDEETPSETHENDENSENKDVDVLDDSDAENNAENDDSRPVHFPFKNATNANDLIEAFADLLADPDDAYQRQRATQRLEKQLSTVFTDQQLKNVSYRQLERAISMQFYRTYDTDGHYWWIKGIYDGYLIAEDETDTIVGRMWQVTYSVDTDTMGITFDDQSQWVQGRMTFEAHNFDQPMTQSRPVSTTDEAGQTDDSAQPPESDSPTSDSHREAFDAKRQALLERAQSLTIPV